MPRRIAGIAADRVRRLLVGRGLACLRRIHRRLEAAVPRTGHRRPVLSIGRSGGRLWLAALAPLRLAGTLAVVGHPPRVRQWWRRTQPGITVDRSDWRNG